MSSGLRQHGASKLIWLLMALLMLGLGGFGISNFSGMSQGSVGQVGDRSVSATDYARAFQAEMQALSAQVGRPVSTLEAQAMGVGARVQAQLFAQAALDDEAARLRLSVGDVELRRQLVAIPAFHGADGKFSVDTYKLVLRQEGLSQAEFERKLRDDAARGLLMGAITGAVEPPATYARTLAAWAGETRSFTDAALLPSDLPGPVPAATDAEALAWYDGHPDAYTRPETRKITYAWLSPEMLAGSVTLDEQALRDAYNKRIDEFVTPEKRLVERLVYPSESEASAAKADLDAGRASFADLAAARGLSLTDADLGEVTKAQLGPAGDAVFALREPGVVGPVMTDLGPALFSMNGIIDAQNISLEEAREDLQGEARLDQARREIADQTSNIEDLLASGATLEDVAKETPMELGTIDFAKGEDQGIAAYTAFRDLAAKATTDDFPALVPLEDGGVFALRVDRIDPPARKPLAEVRDEVAADWRKAELHRRLVAFAQESLAQLDNGATLPTLGLVTTDYRDMARNAYIEGLDPAVLARVFTLEVGKSAVVETPDSVTLITLNAIQPVNQDSEDQVQMRDRLDPQIAQAIGGDMLELYTRAVETDVGVQIDPANLNAINARMQ